MISIVEREVIIECSGRWFALEGDYWPPLLRLIEAYGLDPAPYEVPIDGSKASVSDVDSTRLTECLRAELDEIPLEDLWRHYGNDPDPNGTAACGVMVYVACPASNFVRASSRGSMSRSWGLGRRLTARGSIRFGRLPIR